LAACVGGSRETVSSQRTLPHSQPAPSGASTPVPTESSTACEAAHLNGSWRRLAVLHGFQGEVAFASACRMIGVGQDVAAYPSAARAVFSVDGGRSFLPSRIPDGLTVLRAPVALGLTAYCIGYGKDGYTALRSSDGGRTWRLLALPDSSKEVSAVAFITPRRGWMIGADVAYRTTNGGRNWASSSLPAHTGFIEDVDFADSLHGIAVGGSARHGTVVLTTDGGSHWRSADPLSFRGRLEQVAMTDTKGAWAVGVGARGPSGALLRTVDGGATWSMRSAPGYGTFGIVDIGSTLFIASDETDDVGELAVSRDDGRSWQRFSPPGYTAGRLALGPGQLCGISVNGALYCRSLASGE
jgi:hypothetical protein